MEKNCYPCPNNKMRHTKIWESLPSSQKKYTVNTSYPDATCVQVSNLSYTITDIFLWPVIPYGVVAVLPTMLLIPLSQISFFRIYCSWKYMMQSRRLKVEMGIYTMWPFMSWTTGGSYIPNNHSQFSTWDRLTEGGMCWSVYQISYLSFYY